MGFYRKKPVEVEAHLFTGATTSKGQIEKWIDSGVWQDKEVHTQDYRTMEINTLEGTMTAEPGDYIIKGIKGEFYPCKPDIFRATYEPVGDTGRDPGIYPSKSVMTGDEILFCGKTYTVTSAGVLGENIILALNDGTVMPVRPDTSITVTKAI